MIPYCTSIEWSEWMARFEVVAERVTTGLPTDAVKAAYDLYKAGQTPERAARRIYGIAA